MSPGLDRSVVPNGKAPEGVGWGVKPKVQGDCERRCRKNAPVKTRKGIGVLLFLAEVFSWPFAGNHWSQTVGYRNAAAEASQEFFKNSLELFSPALLSRQ